MSNKNHHADSSPGACTHHGECASPCKSFGPISYCPRKWWRVTLRRDVMRSKVVKKGGIIQTDVTIRNPAEPEKAWKGSFLVDTDATDCLAPRRHLEKIGITPKGQRTYKAADGSEIKMDIATADIEFMDEIAGGTIIFGDDHAEPILGGTALESVGIKVDPLNQRLKRLTAVRLE